MYSRKLHEGVYSAVPDHEWRATAMSFWIELFILNDDGAVTIHIYLLKSEFVLEVC